MPKCTTSPASKICILEGNRYFLNPTLVCVLRLERGLCLIDTTAGQDATDIFFSLHRYEVLQKPQYQRLIIGQIEGEESTIYDRVVGEPSAVPYAEPTWLSSGYHSPYYTEVSPPSTRTCTQSYVRWVFRTTGSSRKPLAAFSMRRSSKMLRIGRRMGSAPVRVLLTRWRKFPFLTRSTKTYVALCVVQ